MSQQLAKQALLPSNVLQRARKIELPRPSSVPNTSGSAPGADDVVSTHTRTHRAHVHGSVVVTSSAASLSPTNLSSASSVSLASSTSANTTASGDHSTPNAHSGGATSDASGPPTPKQAWPATVVVTAAPATSAPSPTSSSASSEHAPASGSASAASNRHAQSVTTGTQTGSADVQHKHATPAAAATPSTAGAGRGLHLEVKKAATPVVDAVRTPPGILSRGRAGFRDSRRAFSNPRLGRPSTDASSPSGVRFAPAQADASSNTDQSSGNTPLHDTLRKLSLNKHSSLPSQGLSTIERPRETAEQLLQSVKSLDFGRVGRRVGDHDRERDTSRDKSRASVAVSVRTSADGSK